MVDWEFCDVFDEWKGEEGMSDFFAMGGNHPIIPAEVADWYPAEIHLKLRGGCEHQATHVMSCVEENGYLLNDP